MSHKILVIGATGMLGEPAARQLLADGFQVRILSRSPEKARARFGDEFEVCRGDVEDPSSLEAALRGCQGVHINLHGTADPDLERRGAENISRAAQAAGVERITYLSGASVCAENCWFADTQARYQAEQAIQSSAVGYTIFRAHFFMETLRNFLRKSAAGSVLLQIGRHPHPYDWVAAADYARMLARAYQEPRSVNQTLYICGPQALTMHQALEIYRRVAHPKARRVYLPLWAASIIARLGKRTELQSVLPFFRYCEQVEIILSGSPDKANALLGAPQITVEQWARESLLLH